MSFKNGLIAAGVFAMATMTGSQTSFAAEGDAVKGERVFKRCIACHSLEPGKKKPTGPNLHGVVGRQAGIDPDYRYSKPMKDAGEGGLVWTEEALFEYLADPRKYVPKSKMILKLPKEQDRLDVIAHLKAAGGTADADGEAPAAPAE